MAEICAPESLPPGRLMALDLGQARIGVAVSDEMGLLASPLTVLRRRATRAEDFATIAALIARERAVGVLIGMPLDSEGQVGPQARWTRRYAGRLAGAITTPVAFWDESLSTVDAALLLREGHGRSGIDAAAATLILGEYLNWRGSRETHPGEKQE